MNGQGPWARKQNLLPLYRSLQNSCEGSERLLEEGKRSDEIHRSTGKSPRFVAASAQCGGPLGDYLSRKNRLTDPNSLKAKLWQSSEGESLRSAPGEGRPSSFLLFLWAAHFEPNKIISTPAIIYLSSLIYLEWASCSCSRSCSCVLRLGTVDMEAVTDVHGGSTGPERLIIDTDPGIGESLQFICLVVTLR